VRMWSDAQTASATGSRVLLQTHGNELQRRWVQT
jgi:hypothetical protein